jgi:hypothetical protein
VHSAERSAICDQGGSIRRCSRRCRRRALRRSGPTQDIPALVRFWRDITSAQRTPSAGPRAASRRPPPRRCERVLAGNVDHLQNVWRIALNAGSGEITTDHVKRLLGEAAAASQPSRKSPRGSSAAAARAREAFERIYFEQLLGREQAT